MKTGAKIVGVLLLFVIGTLLTELPHSTEHWSADWQIAYWAKQLPKQDPHIAVIEITEKTLEKVPYLLPLDRSLLADLIEKIDDAGPKAIGIDIVFDRTTEPAKDRRLIEVLKSAKSTVVIGALDKETMQPQGFSFQSDFIGKSRRRPAHVFLDTRHRHPAIISDHVVRDIAEPLNGEGGMPSLAQALARAWGTTSDNHSTHIAWVRPPDKDSTFLTLPAETVLNNVVPLEPLLKGKVVLIGGNYPDRDQHLTPLSVKSGLRTAGVFIHAQILRQYLDKVTTRTLPWWGLILLFVAAMGLVVLRSKYMVSSKTCEAAFHAVTAVILVGIGFIASRYFDTLVPFVTVWLTIVALSFFLEIVHEISTHGETDHVASPTNPARRHHCGLAYLYRRYIRRNDRAEVG